MRVAIVIAAYNRPDALHRLLNSIAKAHYNSHIDIIISIDNGEREQEVAGVADNFEWNRGAKEVILHNHHMGLKQHMLTCGKLGSDYDAFILLEDDLLVSPWFYNYVHQVLPYYFNEDVIAGISLYHQAYHHALGFPFYPNTTSDVYFMQFPASSGCLYTKEQWMAFANWIVGKDEKALDNLPENVKTWPPTSWKKWMAAYLVDTQKYIVYPTKGLTTNMGNQGEHHKQESNQFQTILAGNKKQWQLETIAESNAVYDVYMEPHASVFKLEEDIEVDLYGLKSGYTKPYVLTTKKVANPIKQWGLNLKPIELNVIMNNAGDEISLAKTTDVKSNGLEIADWWNYHYITPSGIDLVKLLGEKVKKKLK